MREKRSVYQNLQFINDILAEIPIMKMLTVFFVSMYYSDISVRFGGKIGLARRGVDKELFDLRKYPLRWLGYTLRMLDKHVSGRVLFTGHIISCKRPSSG